MSEVWVRPQTPGSHCASNHRCLPLTITRANGEAPTSCYQRVNAFWRFAEIQRIAVEKSAAAITLLELELSPGPEDQFPIIYGTRIYIRERGNKYGVYTAAVHLHGTDAAPVVLRATMGRGRGKFLATGQYFGFPKPFRPIQMDATDNLGNCETTKLRY
ncbi:uncharacterized protein LOC143896051 [Temnothorax americanus]|uniref:uncharacterized protein LOC143896051 n=1 Tax=Temnothorax americanus TaxID=1964332 RepID=UPI004068EC01